MLNVRFLGHYTVQEEGDWIELPNRPAQLLFAYLVIHAGVPQPREHLAALFWPDSTDENARSNLRHALWQLRKALGSADGCLTADDFTITFAPSTGCHVDVAELEREPTTLTSDEQLMASVAVYDGDLLPGFYEPWVVLERERLLAVFEHKMELLLNRLLAAERWTAAIGMAERWIALGATPEPAYRALMTAHDRLGHMSQVHAAYQRCRESLDDNIGLPPSVETTALYERLTLSCPRDTTLPIHSTQTEAPASRTNRQRETAALQKELVAARALAEQERQIAEAHRRAATRSTRLMAGLALALAGAIGALVHDRSQRRSHRQGSS